VVTEIIHDSGRGAPLAKARSPRQLARCPPRCCRASESAGRLRDGMKRAVISLAAGLRR